MFHLFNKAYLEYDFLFTARHQSLLASDQWIKDPLLESFGEAGLYRQTKTLEQLLEKNFENDVENLWKHIIEKDKDSKFILYLNSDSYYKLQIQYWKSIFKDPSLDLIYFLHKVYVQNWRTHFFLSDTFSKEYLQRGRDQIKFLGLEAFTELFNSVEASPFLLQISTSSLSYEYLLADHLSFKDGRPSNAFEDRLKLMCWKFFKSELKSLKEDVVGAVYDEMRLENIRSGNSWDFSKNLNSFEVRIQSDPSMSWLSDEALYSESIEYVRDVYGKDFFIELSLRSLSLDRKDLDQSDSKEDEIVYALRAILNGEYLKLLEFEINKGYGSVLLGGEMRYKVNILLISYIYDLYRNSDYEKIAQLRLR